MPQAFNRLLSFNYIETWCFYPTNLTNKTSISSFIRRNKVHKQKAVGSKPTAYSPKLASAGPQKITLRKPHRLFLKQAVGRPAYTGRCRDPNRLPNRGSPDGSPAEPEFLGGFLKKEEILGRDSGSDEQ